MYSWLWSFLLLLILVLQFCYASWIHICRHQWYQLGPKVTIDIYAKNQKQDAVTVELSNDNSHLKVTIAAAAAGSNGATEQQQAEEDYVLELDLFGQVQPEVKVKSRTPNHHCPCWI